MKRKILLATVLFASATTFAQNFESRTAFWAKSGNLKNAKQILGKSAKTQSLTTDIGAGTSNFYVVFKSEDNVEKDLLDFTFTCYQHTVTTHNINYPDAQTVDLKRKTGAIVKYGFDYPNANGDKNFVTVVDQPNDLTNVYEVIYVNDAFTELDHQQIQTYLSLKYGISLINSGNYFDANGKQIWNNNLNASYNNAITGLGRSDYFGLNKIETINSVDKRLEIRSGDFNNNEYLLIGSNNEQSVWNKQSDVELLNTSWLVQTNTQNQLTSLTFDLGMSLHTNGTYELLVQPSATTFVNDENVVRFQGRVEGNKLVFDNVLFDTDRNGFDTFGIEYSTKSKEISKPQLVNETNINAFPNPVNMGEKVTVAYHFDEPANLNIHVFTVDGRFIAKQEANNVNDYRYETSFSTAGVYLVVSTYSGQVQTSRIVVK